MTSTDEHVNKIRELLKTLNYSIEVGAEHMPVIIGFSCSECSVQMLELYLHNLEKISIGKQLKHNWFKPPQEGQKTKPLAERNISINFQDKKKIFWLMYEIEKGRITLVYGKSDKKDVEKVIRVFNELKNLMKDKLKEEGVEIE